MASILIVDDESDLCDVMRVFLENEGYSVNVSDTAQKALEHLAAQEADVILLDVLMPDANGLEALPQIRALSRAHVVIITGINDYRIADLFYEHGVAAYLQKPLKLRDLSRLIGSLLSRCTTKRTSTHFPATNSRPT